LCFNLNKLLYDNVYWDWWNLYEFVVTYLGWYVKYCLLCVLSLLYNIDPLFHWYLGHIDKILDSDICECTTYDRKCFSTSCHLCDFFFGWAEALLELK